MTINKELINSENQTRQDNSLNRDPNQEDKKFLRQIKDKSYWKNEMETFFIAETVKYLYLLFKESETREKSIFSSTYLYGFPGESGSDHSELENTKSLSYGNRTQAGFGDNTLDRISLTEFVFNTEAHPLKILDIKKEDALEMGLDWYD